MKKLYKMISAIVINNRGDREIRKNMIDTS